MMTIDDLKPKEGWVVNPNSKVVNAIIKGVNRNNGECPCHNNSYDKECPCSDYREQNVCHCQLYVKSTDRVQNDWE